MPITDFLPISRSDLEKRGWKALDVILITGDAYVDHPSYGAALLGRMLESAGFKVGIIAQPDWRTTRDFLALGRPRLFFGITAGNLDSMVANYTANKKLRRTDDYSPGGKIGLRPDRATIVYASRVKEVFKGAPVVIGGIEASLRRIAHYDYWDNDVRRSILLDSKADMLVYGMAEKQILEIANRLSAGENIGNLDDIKGTTIARSDINFLKDYIGIHSFEEVKEDKGKFNKAFIDFYNEQDPYRGRTVVQKHANRFVVQLPPAMPLGTGELSRLSALKFMRAWHPIYDKQGGVPGFEAVRFSVISHRGCSAECNFCSLSVHQGRIIQSRSAESVLKEIEDIAGQKYFRGTITDIGGPTANLYKAACERWTGQGACKDKNCLMPSKCQNLKLGYAETLALWERARRIPGVKHIFIGSGMRYDLLTGKYGQEYLTTLCKYHVSGYLKVAPEHISDPVLKLMNKTGIKSYEDFENSFAYINKKLNKKQFLVNYFISAHPGAGLNEALTLSLHLMKKGLHPEQIQDYIPLPLTVSGAMYYTESDPFTGKRVYVAKTFKERKMQRALLQYKNPSNRALVLEALKKLGQYEKRSLFFKDKQQER